MHCYYHYMPSHCHCNFYYMIHCYICHMIPDTGTCHAIFDPWYPTLLFVMLITWYRHRYLPCFTYYLISNIGTCHAIFITWYLIPLLAMLYLLLDIWYRYLSCCTYYFISDTDTCRAILIACYLTPDMITLDTWHAITGTGTLDLILQHLYYIAHSWLLLLRRLGMIIILLLDIWYSWTPLLLNSCTPELLYFWTPEKGWLLILYSC